MTCINLYPIVIVNKVLCNKSLKYSVSTASI